MAVQITALRDRFTFGTVLLFTMAVATILHFAIGVISPFLEEEFSLSAVQLGILGTVNNGVAAIPPDHPGPRASAHKESVRCIRPVDSTCEPVNPC